MEMEITTDENTIVFARCQRLTAGDHWGGAGDQEFRFSHLDGSYCQKLTPWKKTHFNTRAHTWALVQYMELLPSTEQISRPIGRLFCKELDEKYFRPVEPHMVFVTDFFFFLKTLSEI